MDINRNNYETFFLLYLDGELAPVDKQAVESFLSENADLQKEFILLQQTIFSPEEMVFEPKELLFRKEEKRRVVPIYWVRIAASIAVLLTAGWFIKTGFLNKHKPETGNAQVTVANIPTAKHPVNSALKNKNQTDQIKNKPVGENIVQVNQSVKKESGEIKHSEKAITTKKTLDQNSLVVPLQDESRYAVVKSSTALEIQHDEIPEASDQQSIAALTKTQAPALIIVSTGSANEPKNENADLKETDDQTDNAISVMALNERNKSITGFFKKLTKANPENNKTTSTRKVHVSVFQFSY